MQSTTKQRAGDEFPYLAHAGTFLNGHYAPPPSDKDGKLWVRTSALVLRSPTELYDLWCDIEKAPLWQEQIVEVRVQQARKPRIGLMVTGDDPSKTELNGSRRSSMTSPGSASRGALSMANLTMLAR